MTTHHRILPPIHFHPILLFFIIVSFFTGTFTTLMVILSIVFWHELGHVLAARLYRWRIKGIMLWVFGGVMDTDEHGTRPLYEEIIVTIAGPAQHIMIYLLMFNLAAVDFIPPAIIETVMFYNTVILVFNLLPIWPLDGGKILFLSLSAFKPYRKAYNFTILFSIFASLLLLIFQLFIVPFTLSSVVLLLFLLAENRTDWKQRYYVFMRFLLRRYQGDTSLNGIKWIETSPNCLLMDVFIHFQRGKRHMISISSTDSSAEENHRTIDEMVCLRSYFHDRHYRTSVGEIAADAAP